jgi:hypothetical protein
MPTLHCRLDRFRLAVFRPEACPDSDQYMAAIVADRIVRHLERAGFVVMKKPPALRAVTIRRTGTPGL